MSRYIDADKVLEKINKICNRCGKMNENNGAMCRACYFDDAKDMIDDFPTEEVKPIVRGKWIFKTSKSAKCSNCGHIQFTNGEDTTKKTLIHKALYHYCPMCGAKMKGDNQ